MHAGAGPPPHDGALGLPTEHMCNSSRSLSFVTWTSGGFIPHVAGATRRHQVKRRFLQHLLDRNNIVVPQEMRGTMADLEQLPLSHLHVATFVDVDPHSATSRVWGVIVSASKKFLVGVQVHVWVVHVPGRVASLMLRRKSGISATVVHVKPVWTISAKHAFPRRLVEQTSRLRGFRVMLGDWNFVAARGARERVTEGTVAEDELLNALFDELFEDNAELHQHKRTWRRLPRGLAGLLCSAGWTELMLRFTQLPCGPLQFPQATSPRDRVPVIIEMFGRSFGASGQVGAAASRFWVARR